MNKPPKLVQALCFLILLTSCIREQGYTITGDVSGFPDSTKIYLRNLATDAVFDSTLVNGNKFKFKGQLISPPEQIWLIATVDKKYIYTHLLVGNEKIKVRGNIKDFPWNVEITGSKTQDDYNYLQNLTKEYDIKRDSLIQVFLNIPEGKLDERKIIKEEVGAIDKTTKSLRVEYVKSHSDTYASIIHLGYLKSELPKDTVQAIYDKYSPKIKNSKYAKIVEIFLRENISKIGDEYHDFNGINQNGDTVKFSEIRGDYTLIDFTSAYCGPCIQAAEELVEVNEKYADSLKIVSFSGDPKKDVWLKSLERDGVSWTSVWDGKGRYSETSIKYGVTGFPAFVLINPNGLIVDIWGGYTNGSLINRLDKHLSE